MFDPQEEKREYLMEIYYEGWDAYWAEARGKPIQCPYNGVDEDEQFEYWWNGYSDAGWDD